MWTSYHFSGKHDIKLKVVSGLFYVCSFVLSCKTKSKSSENGGQRSNTSFSPTVPWRLWHHRLSWIDHEQRWYVHINALQLCLCWRKYCSIILTQRLCFDVHVWPTCSLTLAASSLSLLASASIHLYLSVKGATVSGSPYVTGAYIRENNLWSPWIRNAVEIPMIRFWCENSLECLDKRWLSDRRWTARC